MHDNEPFRTSFFLQIHGHPCINYSSQIKCYYLKKFKMASRSICIMLIIPIVSSFIVSSPCIRSAAKIDEQQHHASKQKVRSSCIRTETSLYDADTNAIGEFKTIDDINDSATRAGKRVSISRPVIHWTVPGYKVGWRDENDNWFDEDGPRNGPPQNYWRQSADEREYNMEMAVVDAVLAEYDIESAVRSLEKRRSTRLPSMSRKILGSWAPLLLSSKRLTYNDKAVDNEGDIEVPFTIDVSRSNGRRFGPGNHYGVYDLKLVDGEALTIATTGNDDDICININADESNSQNALGKIGQEQLYFGGITYISDYVMIQRSPEGDIDFMLRADDSYLGISKSELEMYQ
uniref:Uncharacterized protein n=1 Tax=Chaetoceros debilis TaxID=122233 RepID=A0A7S3Q0U3_9STRA|mmetsp:Transcript_16730/g.24531  ORF Transcript_16730/g.24531 Transcript_16730/m.24531 type:complete len:346 (-) Transcript_16730:92-1129(-)